MYYVAIFPLGIDSGFVSKGSGISNVWYIHAGELSYQERKCILFGDVPGEAISAHLVSCFVILLHYFVKPLQLFVILWRYILQHFFVIMQHLCLFAMVLRYYPRATRCGGDIVTVLWFRPCVRAWFRPSVRPCVDLVNTIETKPLHISLSNLADMLTMMRGWTLLILEVRGQRSRSQLTYMEISLWTW